MAYEQHIPEHHADTPQTGAPKAAFDLGPDADSQTPPTAANANEEQVEDPAEVYFAHG